MKKEVDYEKLNEEVYEWLNKARTDPNSLVEHLVQMK